MSKFDDFTTYQWVHSDSHNLFERFLIRKVLKNILVEGKFAVDIGCGPGLVLREMRHIYSYCVGIDISPRILRRAKSHSEVEEKRNIDLLCADVEYLPFKDSTFEVATMYSVLHHLPNLNGSVKEIGRVMTPQSPLILFHEPHEMHMRSVLEKTLIRILGKVRALLLRSVHKRKWQLFRKEAQLRFKKLGTLEEMADFHSKKGFSIIEIKMLLEESGFEIVQIKTRIQSFMTTFSRLYWPIKSIAVLDFVLSEVPILKNYLPLLFCIAKRRC
jgi:ubiquinone/menaquinone biosynthesis C-methylase UbiE